MSRVAILGGSFNPPHLAHQMACLWLLASEAADQVWLMPCNQHAFGKPLEAFDHRCAMCQTLGQVFRPGAVQVTRVEQELGGTSRTLHTVQHLIATHPEHRFSLVIGADILEERHNWYGFDQVEELVDVLVVGRSGYPSPEGAPVLPAISSTEVRRRLRAGEDVSAMVPRGVADYIARHGLFRVR